ncbi:MAG: O-antigen ligase family protein [Lachnospiraceae bacterium]|nr:O-antigen ligase family protein [Lachnospiraceae bacterium]
MSRRFVIKRDSFLLFFYLFLLIKPQYFTSMNEYMPLAFAGMQLFVLLIIALKKKIHLDSFMVGVIVFFLYQFINNTIQGGTKSYITTIISGLYACLIVQHLYYDYMGNQLFFFAYRVFTILLGINLLMGTLGLNLTVLYHNREEDIFFLGRYNQITCYIIVAILLLYLCYSSGKIKTFEFITSATIILLNKLYVPSATLTICIIIMLLSFVLTKLPRRIVKLITPLNVSILLVVLFYILTISFNFGFMAKIFERLGKDVTLSQRTEIWKIVYVTLASFKNLVFGLGEKSGGAYITIWTGNTFSAHNLFLQLMLEGGIILLGIYLYMYFCTLRNVRKINDNNQRARICLIVLVYFISCMTEVFPIYMNLVFLYFLYLFCIDQKSMKKTGYIMR